MHLSVTFIRNHTLGRLISRRDFLLELFFLKPVIIVPFTSFDMNLETTFLRLGPRSTYPNYSSGPIIGTINKNICTQSRLKTANGDLKQQVFIFAWNCALFYSYNSVISSELFEQKYHAWMFFLR